MTDQLIPETAVEIDWYTAHALSRIIYAAKTSDGERDSADYMRVAIWHDLYFRPRYRSRTVTTERPDIGDAALVRMQQ